MKNSNNLNLFETSVRSGMEEQELEEAAGKPNPEHSFYNSLCLNSGNVGGFMRESRNGESETLNMSSNQVKVLNSKEGVNLRIVGTGSEEEKMDTKVSAVFILSCRNERKERNLNRERLVWRKEINLRFTQRRSPRTEWRTGSSRPTSSTGK